MVFSKKTNGYFIEANSHSVLLAKTSALRGPLVIQEMTSVPSNNAGALEDALKALQPKKTGQYIHAICGTYSDNRIVRHATLDPKRYKESDYINEVLSTSVRVDADKYTLAFLDAGNGQDFDLANATRKEALFAGMPSDELQNLQKSLLDQGIFPESLEIGTLSTLGAIVDYLAFSKIKTPTLVLEIDSNSTQSYIVSEVGVENSRVIPQGLEAMIPAVQKELGLKDADAAKKLFYSNAFDFTGIGPALIKKLLKELQSSIGFYEVQTGQSIGNVLCTLLPPKLTWLEQAIASQLGVGTLTIDYPNWLKAKGVSIAPSVDKQELNNRWLGLFSLMITPSNAVAA
jgi:hypothetical protein